MEDGALFKRLICEFAKTIDDSLLPETTTSSLGLKIASQMQWRVKRCSIYRKVSQGKHCL